MLTFASAAGHMGDMTAPDTSACSFGTFFDPDPDDERLGFGLDLIHSCPRFPVHPGLISLALTEPSLVQINHNMQVSQAASPGGLS